jgi:hypothetical protein
MKKLFFLVITLSLALSSCLPAGLQPQPTATPNLEATAAVFSQQTLQARPTQTVAPSVTPVITTPTSTETPTQATSTETQNPALLTLTATLGTGTAAVGNGPSALGTPGTPTITVTGTLPLTKTPSVTPNPALNIATGTPHPQHAGTMPPNLPYGEITLINKSKADAYISLRCVTKDNYVTIIEYPVKGTVTTRAPAGQYTYVLWVGGRQIIGSFGLSKSQDRTITIYKDRVGIR